MKVIIFGAGNFYQERKKTLWGFQDVEIVAFADNNEMLWGRKVDGIPVIPPKAIENYKYDRIVMMSIYTQEIYRQLLDFGIARKKIRFWEPFYAECMMEIYAGNPDLEDGYGEVLIVSIYLNYNGGSMAAVYAAKALEKSGISTVLLVPGGNEKCIQEVAAFGVTVVVCPLLPYLLDWRKEWARQFEAVLVNTSPMLEYTYEISRICPMMLWLHEYSPEYCLEVARRLGEADEGDQLADINVYAVSRKALDNFNRVCLSWSGKLLPYGIPDMAGRSLNGVEHGKGIVFACIGAVLFRKAQDLFLEAASRMGSDSGAEFWIIGNMEDDDYCVRIRRMAAGIRSVRIKGMLSRSEIYAAFSEIDVVVCPSREDPLPIVVTEAMMFQKACIVADTTGSMDYIRDGVNGLVVHGNDARALAEKMEWVIAHREELGTIGKAARKTYEEYFTMDVFAENLKKALDETKAGEW